MTDKIYRIFNSTENTVEHMHFKTADEAEAFVNEHKDWYYNCHVEIFYYDDDDNLRDVTVKSFDVV